MAEHIDDRLARLARYLVHSDRYSTLSELTEYLGVSKRTVQNDILRLRQWIECNGLDKSLNIISKNGKGVCLERKDINVSELDALLSTKDNDFRSPDNFDRRMEIIKFMLFSKDNLTIQFLADQFYVSKSVILKDFKLINRWLSAFKLTTSRCQNKGVQIVGDEINRRSAIVEMIDVSNSVDKNQYNQPLFFDTVNLLRLDLQKFYQSIHINPKVDIGKIVEIIHEAESIYDFQFANTYYTGLLVHLSIAVERIIYDIGNISTQDVPEEIMESSEGIIAEFIAGAIERQFAIKVPKSERVFICIHIIGANVCGNNRVSSDESGDNRFRDFSKLLATFVENITHYQFSQDAVLLSGLETHIKKSNFRLKSGLISNSVRLQHSQHQYEELYRAVWASATLYAGSLGLLPNKEELEDIYMHFVFSMRRQKSACTAIAVYDEGIVTAEQIYSAIIKYSPQVNLIDMCHRSQLTDTMLERCQIVLSTVEVNTKGRPLFIISPDFECQAFEAVTRFIASAKFADNSSVAPPAQTDILLEGGSLDSVTDEMTTYLVKQGYDERLVISELFELERSGRALTKGSVLYYILYIAREGNSRLIHARLTDAIHFGGHTISDFHFMILDKEYIKKCSPEDQAQAFCQFFSFGDDETEKQEVSS